MRVIRDLFSPRELLILALMGVAILTARWTTLKAAIDVQAASRIQQHPPHHYKIVQKHLTYGQDPEWKSGNRAISISCTSSLAYCAVLIEVEQ